MVKNSIRTVQYDKNSVNAGPWMAVNVGTVLMAIVNIGIWFATKF